MSEAQRDEVVPRGAWQFDQEVTAVFDDMLQRSIPQYNAMRMVTFEVGRRFVQPDTAIIDMGCSRGQALLPFVSSFGAANDYIGLEISEPMIEAARQNFNYHPHGNRVTIQSADLRHEFPGVTSSLVLSVLTLQFTPIEYRQQIIRRVFGGVSELLSQLPARHEATVGLLTGNTAGGAASKMRHFGLAHHFAFGACGCDHADRNRLGPIALERAVAHAGQTFTAAETWIIGDTPKDIACAHAIGARCLAVATGQFSAAALEFHGADRVVETLDLALDCF
jgi:phosphoglycolate phosphatase-like HAD superfamily hydrolase